MGAQWQPTAAAWRGGWPALVRKAQSPAESTAARAGRECGSLAAPWQARVQPALHPDVVLAHGRLRWQMGSGTSTGAASREWLPGRLWLMLPTTAPAS